MAIINRGIMPAATTSVESSPLVNKDETALDEGGEIPITRATIGLFLITIIKHAERGATMNMGLSILTIYLNAPANVIAASYAVVPIPHMFIILPGMLSDTVRLCGSRRKVCAVARLDFLCSRQF